MSDRVATEHEPGIYFGLPEDQYHADPAHGSTAIKRLSNDPTEYWHHSHMNEMRKADEPEDDTPAKIKGRALHSMVFDGEEAFEQRFAVKPEKSQFDNLLVTNADLEEHLKDLTDEKLPTKKADLIAKVLEHDPEAQIWSEIEQGFLERCSEGEQTPISTESYTEIKYASAMISKNPNLIDAFGNGRSEVSVFWEEAGLRMKCRFDFLKANANVDLKSIAAQGGRIISFKRACLLAVSNYRYDIQAAHYMDGRHAARKLIREGRVFGNNPPSRKWLNHIAKINRFAFLFVFHRVGGAPLSHGVQIDPGSGWHIAGRSGKHQALENYQEYFGRFGTDTWFGHSPIHHLEDDEIPSWMGL